MERKQQKLEHYEKYLDYADKLGVSFIQAHNLRDLVNCVAMFGDIHFNRIPLWQWDGYHGWYRTKANQLKLDPLGWSTVNSVGTAKAAALQAVLIHITQEDITTAEELVNAIERVVK